MPKRSGKQLTVSERLLQRLRNEGVLDIPEGTVIHRTHAGRLQKRAGAWAWFAVGPDGGEICGGYEPVSALAKKKHLTASLELDRHRSSEKPSISGSEQACA